MPPLSHVMPSHGMIAIMQKVKINMFPSSNDRNCSVIDVFVLFAHCTELISISYCSV